MTNYVPAHDVVTTSWLPTGNVTKLRCSNVSGNFTFPVVGRQITLQLRNNHVLWLAGERFILEVEKHTLYDSKNPFFKISINGVWDNGV